jgi:hypothetical protein
MSAYTPLIGIAHQITRFIRDQAHLMAIGNTQTPWETEGIAPAVPNNLLVLPEIGGYFPIKKVAPIIPHEDGELLSDGTRWIEIHGDEPDLAAAACRAVLFEVDIRHSVLPLNVVKYRSAGLFSGCFTPEAIDAESFFLPNQVVGYLDSVWYFPAITVASNQVQTLQLIRRF